MAISTFVYVATQSFVLALIAAVAALIVSAVAPREFSLEIVRDSNMLRIAISAVVFTAVSVASASAAPAALLNKTVHISYNLYIASTDGAHYPPRSNTLTLYISSAGRVFAKKVARAGRYGKERETVGGNYRFVGTKLIGTRHFGNGAGQILISFDRAFQSCSIEIAVGSEKGKRLEWTSLSGVKRTASGREVLSGQTCTIENGNAFAH